MDGSRESRQGRLFSPFGWGGARKGAGRKPTQNRPKGYVPHQRREAVKGRHPIHVTCRIAEGLPSMRSSEVLRRLSVCFEKANGVAPNAFRLVHFSVQSNHIHMIVEAADNSSMTAGMRGLMVRVAHALNRLWGRRGKLFSNRYHAVILETPRQVRNAIRYVLNNARHHGHRIIEAFDRFASGRWFDGWSSSVSRNQPEAGPVSRPRTWLLRTGWRRHGLIGPHEVPG